MSGATSHDTVSRTLIAGFGNVLRGDDAFGVEVIHRLEALGVGDDGIELMEVGTGGIRLAQELLTPCDCLIIADAMARGGAPGTVYVLEVESVERVNAVDMHVAIPSHALSVAQALGVLPRRVVLVGCEPLLVDELTFEISAPVLAAIDVAVERIRVLVSELHPLPSSVPIPVPTGAARYTAPFTDHFYEVAESDGKNTRAALP